MAWIWIEGRKEDGSATAQTNNISMRHMTLSAFAMSKATTVIRMMCIWGIYSSLLQTKHRQAWAGKVLGYEENVMVSHRFWEASLMI
jgi:hypothetical protein